MYAELNSREIDSVLITRDTTDADLLQRRELSRGNVRFIDGPVVNAALAGRLFVLDGMERAERNVLPVLNNLLENRTCPLDGGGSLISAQRYDSLLQTHSKSELDALQLRRCHKRFRIIAIGTTHNRSSLYRSRTLSTT